MSAIHIPPDPRKGDALSAGWARSLVAALRAMRLSVCWPLTLTQTPEGTSLRLATGAGPQDPDPKPWDVSFSVDGEGACTATFAHCALQRGMVTRFFEDMTYEMPSASGDLYLSRKYDTSTGVCEIISGSRPGDVTDAEQVDSSPAVKTLLYRVTPAGASWTVKEDWRDMPREMVYS